ncbi:uncharacterized protein BcabD6B2_24550 [Babesia caballi]|uniref:Uncharacterized protein n=1 Tax=Babesia caballi TaxID=5871 RepID=A0AAV4LTC5_BABCB|nr:hypothetical protein BcabD6B2_24550 [Babesia caballi]
MRTHRNLELALRGIGGSVDVHVEDAVFAVLTMQFDCADGSERIGEVPLNLDLFVEDSMLLVGQDTVGGIDNDEVSNACTKGKHTMDTVALGGGVEFLPFMAAVGSPVTVDNSGDLAASLRSECVLQVALFELVLNPHATVLARVHDVDFQIPCAHEGSGADKQRSCDGGKIELHFEIYLYAHRNLPSSGVKRSDAAGVRYGRSSRMAWGFFRACDACGHL